MKLNVLRLLGAAAAATALAAPAAHADTLDFESGALTGLYLPGDSFVMGAYTLTTRLDFGIIDSAVSLGAQSPTGNATQFYFNSNDGALDVARTDGGLFSLSSFAAAFVPLDPASLQTTVIVATATLANNSQVSVFWNFGTSLTTHFPFTTYSPSITATAFGAVKLVQFHACSLVGGVTCSQPTMNNGQFAIDNLVVGAPVPEPAPLALLTVGLAAIGLRAHRNTQRAAR